MMSNSFKVDVSPGMGVYRHYQNYPYSIQTALAEFIDNSVQSYIDNQEAISIIDNKQNGLKVAICIKTETNEISVTDNAGGINKENFEKAIQLGTSVKHPETSLSKFGLGMKTAATWFSSIWKIETSALNSTNKLMSEFNLDELEQKKETKISVFVDKEKEKTHYTKIIINNSQRIESKKYYEEVVIPHLTETFFKFKEFLSIRFEFDNEALKSKRKGKISKAYFHPPEPLTCPILDKDGKPLQSTNEQWKRKIEINDGDQKVKGHFIIMQKGSYLQPGIRLLRNRRVIEGTIVEPNRPPILFQTGLNKYAGFRLYGELHLTNFELDFMKTKFVGLDSLYLKLKEELQKSPNFIHQLNKLRRDTESVEQSPESVSEKSLDRDIIIKNPTGQTRRRKLKTPSNTTKIAPSEEIKNKLEKLKKKKLFHLYNSLCIISLVEHPYLAYIGSLVFLEGLSVLMGNDGIKKQHIDAFYKNKLDHWEEYKNKKNTKKRIRDAIKEIHSKGNFSKHDFDYEFSDAKQLHHEFKVLEQFIIKCIDNIQDS